VRQDRKRTLQKTRPLNDFKANFGFYPALIRCTPAAESGSF
jgi:hypothetical protein